MAAIAVVAKDANRMEIIMADFELFRAFQDGMILQREKNVNVWGFASPGVTVTVKLDDKQCEAVADEEGIFEASIYTGEAGGPHTMTVTGGSDIVEVNDILYGDVYLISGQSNMQLPIERTIDLIGDRIDSVNYPMIRELRVPEIMRFGEVTRQLPECRWYRAVGDDLLLMSAAGFNFAERVYLEENVPIGLINNSIGGTPIESHLPEELLRKMGGYDEIIDQCLDKKYVEDTMASDMDRMNGWYSDLYNADRGFGDSSYADPEYDDSDWDKIDIPVFFGDTDIGSYHGSIWFRREIDIPEDYNINGVMLRLGTLIDGDEAYVNGVKVGETAYMYPPRRYRIPDGLLKHGKNVIAMRVIINRNTGGFTQNKKYCLQGNACIFEGGYTDGTIISEYAMPDSLKGKMNTGVRSESAEASVGNASPESGKWELDLSGTWRYSYGAKMEELPMQTFFIYKPSALYNGMMYPVKRYTCRAGLWYQGESNDSHPEGYAKLMEALIDCWREWFGDDLPFMFVGLPQYDDPARVVTKDSWAVIREEQRRVLYSRDNTAMAVTIDVGEANDLHPQTKEAVGKRLALAAEALVYGKDVEYSGPKLESVRYSEKDNEIRLTFTHCTGGIKKINDNNYFEIGLISASESVYDPFITWIRPSDADDIRISGENTVVITLSDDIRHIIDTQNEKPAAVRYCYDNCPSDPPLYNGADLPMIPFAVII